MNDEILSIKQSRVEADYPDECVVRRFTPSQMRELDKMANLLDEAAENLRGLMNTIEAEKLQVRVWSPDELEGCAILLRNIVKNTLDI